MELILFEKKKVLPFGAGKGMLWSEDIYDLLWPTQSLTK